MATTYNSMYNIAKYSLLKGLHDFSTGTAGAYRCLLLKAGLYTFDVDDNYVSDLTPGTNELSGTGYARVSLTSLTVTKKTSGDTPANCGLWDCADIAWTGLNAGAFDAYVIYKYDAGGDGASELVMYGYLGSYDPAGNNFTIVVDATNGLLQELGA